MLQANSVPLCPILTEMLSTGLTILPDGSKRKVMGAISQALAMALYRAVLRERPGVVVEIGMAQGVSTIAILAALRQTGGRLISIDPYMHSLKPGEPWPEGMAAALYAVQRGGYADIHQHIHAKSCDALPRLLTENKDQVQMGYIDGAHDFANCFVDHFYLDQLLTIGGVLAFNDAGWLGVWSTIKYLERCKRYQEFDVGLPRSYVGRNPLVTAIRWARNVQRQDRYFRKLAVCRPD